jgi:hypothetical protein
MGERRKSGAVYPGLVNVRSGKSVKQPLGGWCKQSSLARVCIETPPERE